MTLLFLFFFRVKVDFCLIWALLRLEKHGKVCLSTASRSLGENTGKYLGKLLETHEKLVGNSRENLVKL